MTVCRFKSGVWQKRGGWYPNARYIYIFIIYIYNIYICIYIYMYIGFWKMKNQINWLPLAIQGERRIALGKLFPNRLSHRRYPPPQKKKKNCLSINRYLEDDSPENCPLMNCPTTNCLVEDLPPKNCLDIIVPQYLYNRAKPTIFCKIYLEFTRFYWKFWFEVKF